MSREEQRKLFLEDLARFVASRLTVEEAVDVVSRRARRQVSLDMVRGDVPSDIASFSELHDHVDANYYGNAFDWPGSFASDGPGDFYHELFTSFWNEVQGNVDQWLKGRVG